MQPEMENFCLKNYYFIKCSPCVCVFFFTRPKRSVARPLTASVVNQPPWRADLIVRAGSYFLFGGNRCCKFSSTGAQNYAMSSQTQVNTKLKFSTRYAFSKFQTQTVNKPFTYNNILRLDDCHHTFSLITPDYFRNRWRTETEWVSCTIRNST